MYTVKDHRKGSSMGKVSASKARELLSPSGKTEKLLRRRQRQSAGDQALVPPPPPPPPPSMMTSNPTSPGSPDRNMRIPLSRPKGRLSSKKSLRTAASNLQDRQEPYAAPTQQQPQRQGLDAPNEGALTTYPVEEQGGVGSDLEVERKVWARRIQDGNAVLARVLVEAKQAREAILAQYEKLDEERAEVFAMRAEHNESKLETALGELPLARQPRTIKENPAGGQYHEAVCKLLTKFRANQHKTHERLMAAARAGEEAMLQGGWEAADAAMSEISSLVSYSNLDAYFAEKWGDSGADFLDRRKLAVKSNVYFESVIPATPDARIHAPVGLSSRVLELEKELENMSKKNSVLKSSIAALRKKAAGAGGGDMELLARVKPPAKIDWNTLPPHWQTVAQACLADVVEGTLDNHPRSRGLSEVILNEVQEFVIEDSLDHLARLLHPITKDAVSGKIKPPSKESCYRVLESAAMNMELAPLTSMSLSYAQYRPAPGRSSSR